MSWLRDVDKWFASEVHPHQHAFQALARRVTGNSEVARDIVQDVYAEVLAGRRWREVNDAKAFILRVVYCRSVDWVRQQKVVPLQAVQSYEGVSYADLGPDAFDKLAGREELLAVFEILERLPTRCRQVITMRRIDDVPPRTIAKCLGISLKTVEGHLARGIAVISEELEKRAAGCGRRGATKAKITRKVE